MGAHPKNKITSVERGKRRHGNTPKLNKDANTVVPPYKRGLFDKLMNMISTKGAASADDSKKEKVSKAATAAPLSQQAKAAPTKGAVTVKKTTRTQHKGG